MKKDIQLMLIVNGLILFVILTQVFDLMTLLIDDSFKDAIVESELTPVKYTEKDGKMVPDRPLLVPKIIHQTYKNETVPAVWKEVQESVRNQTQGYKYILWTDETARQFIADHYAYFLPTYDSYPYPIMRADVIRYFVLYHYGGVYIDMDLGCDKSIDPLLAFPAVFRKTDPTGVSNDLMAAEKGHPFFLYIMNNLERYNRNWFISYVTIMYSTGPLVVSVLWKKYKRWGVPDGGRVRILFPPDHKTHMTYFFHTARGSSWHLGDAKFIIQMGQHWIFFTILGTCIVLSLLYLQLKFYQMLVSGSIFRYVRRLTRRFRRDEPSYEMLEPEV